MNSIFDFEKFCKTIHKAVNEIVSLEEVKQIVQLDEGAYFRDSPSSVGKSLVIKSLEFTGQKSNGDDIHYAREFGLGLNLWVGDNLVGKSSIFNIIKLALTGRNKLSKEVRKWIKEIWLEFVIGTNRYTVHVKMGDKYVFSFYNGSKDNVYHKTEEEIQTALKFITGIGGYEDQIQNFFFQELRYYPLQWTQSSSQKDNPNLLTSNASWSTYYHSIFLEADEYDKLVIGNQPVLILQMLFGLELTYPINRLKVEKDRLEREIGLKKQNQPANDTNIAQEVEKLNNLIAKTNTELAALQEEKKAAINAPNFAVLTKQLEEAKKKYSELNIKQRQLYASLNEQERLWEELDKKVLKYQGEIDEYEVEITKQQRKISDVREEIEIGAFFAGLEVKTCPCCSHQVQTARIKKEKDSKRCRLCDEELETQEVNQEDSERRIAELNDKALKLRKDQYQLKMERSGFVDEIKKVKERKTYLSNQLNALPLSHCFAEIERIEKVISQNRPIFDYEAYLKKYEELTDRKVDLSHQLSVVKKPSDTAVAISSHNTEAESKVLVLKHAIDELQRNREIKSQKLFEQFETIYLQLLHDFGLNHYEKVTITPDFKIEYTKYGEIAAFEDTSPGEKLRAKLGLYIALIEMDVQHQLGKHPRFIILDSPAREEGDRSFVEGLKETLSYIENKFGSELQIFIGTAERDLAEINVDSNKVETRGEKEYFF